MSRSMREEIKLVEEGLRTLQKFVAEKYEFNVDYEPTEDPEVELYLDDLDPNNPDALLNFISKRYKDQAWQVVNDMTGEIMADWENDGTWQDAGKSVNTRKGRTPREIANDKKQDHNYSMRQLSKEDLIKRLAKEGSDGGLTGRALERYIVDQAKRFTDEYISAVTVAATLYDSGYDTVSDNSGYDTVSSGAAFRIVQKFMDKLAMSFPDGDPGDVWFSVLYSAGVRDDDTKIKQALKKVTGTDDPYAYYDMLKADFAPESEPAYDLSEEKLDEYNPFGGVTGRKHGEKPRNRFSHIDDPEKLQNMADRLSREGAPGDSSDESDARRQIHARIRELTETKKKSKKTKYIKESVDSVKKAYWFWKNK